MKKTFALVSGFSTLAFAAGLSAALASHARGEAAEVKAPVAGDPLPQGARARLGARRPVADGTKVIASTSISADGGRFACGGLVVEPATGKVLFDSNVFGECALSADGGTLVSPATKAARVFEVSTGRERPALTADDKSQLSFGHGSRTGKLSSDGALVALETKDAAGAVGVGVWSTLTGKLVQTLAGARSPEIGGTLLFALVEAAPQKGAVQVVVWDTVAGKEVKRFAAAGVESPAVCCAASRDGKTVVVASENGADQGNASVFDSATGDRLHTILAAKAPRLQTVLGFARNGELAVAGTGARDSIDAISFLDARSGEVKRTVRGNWSDALEVPSEGRAFVAVTPSGKLATFDSETGKQIGSPAGHASPVQGLAFSTDGKTLATASQGSVDERVILWNAATGTESQRVKVTPDLVSPRVAVERVAMCSDGRHLAVTFHGGETETSGLVRLFDLESGRIVRSMSGKELQLTKSKDLDPAADISFSPDGRFLATTGTPLQFWDVAAGKLSAINTRPEIVDVSAVACVTSSSEVVYGLRKGGDLYVAKQIGAAAKVIGSVDARGTGVTRIAVSSDGRFVGACSGADGKVSLLDRTQRGSRSLELYGCVAISPDGKWLAGRGADPRKGAHSTDVLLCSVATGAVTKLGAHAEGVTALAFSPDGKTLASGSEDTTVILWDVPESK